MRSIRIETKEKIIVQKLFIATALLVAAAALPAIAQNSAIRANIPFEFHVGTAVLPAGEYNIADGANRDSLTVRSVDGKYSATVIALAQDAPAGSAGASPSVKFRHVDGKAYLASVTRPANGRDVGAPAGVGYEVLARYKGAKIASR